MRSRNLVVEMRKRDVGCVVEREVAISDWVMRSSLVSSEAREASDRRLAPDEIARREAT
jgi:hypothetical protein